MKFKYVKNFSGREATMLLYDEIGESINEYGMPVGVNGTLFAKEMYALNGMIDLLKLRINGPGGLVIEGQKIFSAIENVGYRVETYNDGIAASMHGVIFQAGATRWAADYSGFMMHPVSGPQDTEEDRAVMELMKKSVATMISTRSGVGLDSVLEKMSRETWMNAEEMVKEGFADAVFTVKRKPAVAAEKDPRKMYAICNSFLTKNNSMEKVSKIFGLSNDASEDSIAQAASDLKAQGEASEKKVQELEEQKKALEAKVAELENEVKENEKKKAEELVENAMKAGKIKNEGKDSFLKLALADFEAAKNALESIVESRVKFNNLADRGTSGTGGDERADWGLKEWSQKDPAGLKEIMANDKERYEKLIEKSYGKTAK